MFTLLHSDLSSYRITIIAFYFIVQEHVCENYEYPNPFLSKGFLKLISNTCFFGWRIALFWLIMFHFCKSADASLKSNPAASAGVDPLAMGAGGGGAGPNALTAGLALNGIKGGNGVVSEQV